MKRLVIEIPEPGDERYQRCGFDVVDEQDRRANGLNFDEMLGQVVSITHPKLDGRPQYAMKTREEWSADMAARMSRNTQASVLAAALGAPESEPLDDLPF